MWGLTSPKTSLLQCKVNEGWNMTPERAEREPLMHMMAECNREKPTHHSTIRGLPFGR